MSPTVSHPMVGETEQASHTEIRILPCRRAQPLEGFDRQVLFLAIDKNFVPFHEFLYATSTITLLLVECVKCDDSICPLFCLHL